MFVRTNNNIDNLQNSRLSELNALLHVVQTLNANQQENRVENYMDENYPSIEVSNSCIRRQNINNQASSSSSSSSPSPASNTSPDGLGPTPGAISSTIDSASNPDSSAI